MNPMPNKCLNHTEVKKHFRININNKIAIGGKLIFEHDIIAIVRMPNKAIYLFYGAEITRAHSENEASAKLGPILFHHFTCEGLLD